MGWPLPSGVENSSLAHYYITSTTNILFDRLIKQPNDAVLVIVDYANLPPPNTVNTYSFAVDAASNPPLVIAYDQLVGGTQLVFLLSGGIAGQQYNISITVTGAIGRTDVLRVNMPTSDACDCAAAPANLPGYISSLPPAGPFTNTGLRYFWGTEPNAPNLMDQWYDPVSKNLYEWATDGTNYFWETIASPQLLLDAPSINLFYARYDGSWTPIPVQVDAPSNSQSYVRNNGAWVLASIQSDAPDSQSYARSKGAWTLIPPQAITSDAPSDGNLYGRMNAAWTQVPPQVITSDAPSDGNAYLRLHGSWQSGGALTGALTVQGNLTTNSSLSVGINATITGVATFGAQVNLAVDPIANLQAATKQYVDNKVTSATSGGPFLPLSGGTMTGALVLAADPATALGSSTKQYVDGRTPITIDAPNDGQIYCRQNYGWVLSPSGGMSDAPNNAYVYVRGQAGWQTGGTLSGSLTVNGTVTLSADPVAPLQAATKQYVDSKVAVPGSTVPLMDGTATIGVATQYARGDHVHPTDTSRYAASNPSSYVNAAGAAAAAPVQSVAGRTGAVTLTHTDITDWSATLAPYAPLASPVFTGTVTIPAGANIAGYAPTASPTFTGTVTIPAGANISGYAPLASPAFTGTPSLGPAIATTPPTQVNTTRVATTAWVNNYFLPLTGGTLSGDLSMNGAAGQPIGYTATALTTGYSFLQLQSAVPTSGNAAAGNWIIGNTNNYRWQMALGDGADETGANAGSNFQIQNYSDSGAYIGAPIVINRASGNLTHNFGVNFGSQFAPSTTDCSLHLALYGVGASAWGGLNVTSGRMNLIASSAVAMWFDGTQNHSTLPVALPGNPTSALQAAPKQYVDSAAAPLNHSLTFRNRIRNGDMLFDQRNENGAITAAGYGPDGWKLASSQASKLQLQRAAMGVANSGITHTNFELLATSLSAYTAASTDGFFVQQSIEADAIVDFQFGGSGAQNIVLSFWAAATVAGAYSVALRNSALNRSYVTTYTLTSGPWTYIQISIPGDTAGTWVTSGNGVGLQVDFDCGCGPTFQTSTLNAWQAGNYLASTSAVRLVANNGAALLWTNIQLELGSTATPFEVIPPDVALARAQRYYEKSYDIGTARGTVTNAGWSAVSAYGLPSAIYTPLNLTKFKVNKRVAPTITIYSNVTGASGMVRDQINNADIAATPTNISTSSFYTNVAQSVAGIGWNQAYQWAADADY